MKIVISMKNPDCVSDAVREAAIEFLSKKYRWDPLEETIQAKEKSIQKALAKWIEYEEYINVEFDLEKGTATVLKNDGR